MNFFDILYILFSIGTGISLIIVLYSHMTISDDELKDDYIPYKSKYTLEVCEDDKYNDPKIQNFISENNLENNYRYLGVIPFKDVLSLIYHSTAIINPSKFEGRSSTVEQAKSMSKKIILSNINIHKEQKPENANYFDPNNYKQLSKILLNNCRHKNKDKNYYKNAQQKNDDDMKIYCNNYLKIVKNLINGST